MNIGTLRLHIQPLDQVQNLPGIHVVGQNNQRVGPLVGDDLQVLLTGCDLAGLLSAAGRGRSPRDLASLLDHLGE